MDDRIRVSDADREAVTARLRDHFAEGRLTTAELDERVSAALNAKTFGELRSLTADLPGPAPVPPRTAARPHGGGAPWDRPPWGGPPWGGPPWRRRRHPPVLLFLLLALLVTVAAGGGWVLFAFLRLMLVFWLVSILARIVFGLAHRHRHRYWYTRPGRFREMPGRDR
jgi:hypothetical protein